jgi:serine protease Do
MSRRDSNKHRNHTLLIVLGIIAVVAATVLYGAGSLRVSEEEPVETPGQVTTLSGTNALELIQESFREVAQKVLPVTVQIDIVDVVKEPYQRYQSPFDFFFGPRQGPGEEREFRRRGLGSGVIVQRSGNTVYVLTNNHVVGEADEIVVTLHDKRRFTATLVGKDPRKDLALVEFDTDEEIPVAIIGNSDMVQVGDLVFAVGNPLGFESSITSGIISAVGRKPVAGTAIAGFTDYIQTDAAINRGNSGGPLVNIRGEVIGINTWISSPDGGNIGLGFTIPINNAKQAIDDFISKGAVDYGWLGINIGDPSLEMKEDMKVGDETGAFVSDVFKGSPADRAGVLPGDFITHINGEMIDDATSLVFTVSNLPIGETSDFRLIRYGKPLEIQVKISAREDEETIREQRKAMWPGMSVVKITEDIQKQLNLPKRMGELIIGNVSQNGPAGLAGFRPGDIIKEINGKPVKSMMEFYRTINESESEELMFRLYRQDTEVLLGLIRK